MWWCSQLSAVSMQGKTSQVACKKEMLLREGVKFETDGTVAMTSVVSCTELEALCVLPADGTVAQESC